MLSRETVDRALELVRKDPDKPECQILEVAVVSRLLDERDALVAHVVERAREEADEAQGRYLRGEDETMPGDFDENAVLSEVVSETGERQIESYIDIVQKSAKKARAK